MMFIFAGLGVLFAMVSGYLAMAILLLSAVGLSFFFVFRGLLISIFDENTSNQKTVDIGVTKESLILAPRAREIEDDLLGRLNVS